MDDADRMAGLDGQAGRGLAAADAQAARDDADRTVTLLHNVALLGTVGRLSEELVADRGLPRSAAVKDAVRAELLRGGWAGRRRFAQRVARGLAWRLFRRRIFEDLPAAPEPPRGGPARLPLQYGRLAGGLGAWRALTPAAAQCTPPRDDEWQADRAREEAQAAWARLAAARPDLPYLRALRPHGGARGRLRVLVLLGGGGLGDALLFSAMLAELRARLAPCEIVLFFEKGVAEALYEGNPNVACAVSAPWSMLQETMLAMRWAGIFDLVVDIFCFLPRYLVCERSRIDMDRHGLWLDGNRQLGDVIDRFSSNLGMALLDRACGMHVFDLLGATGGLPLHAGSPLAFSPDPGALAAVRALCLPQAYVTVRDGANPGDLAMARELGVTRATKQLPQPKWAEICAAIRAQGLAIVQVGDKGDAEVAGADLDLRGRTSLSELCVIMKGAVVHVDTEGGLAHFARASNLPAIVFFGPTSDSFFGYPTSLNLASPRCAHCWYATPNWVARCPVQPGGDPCGMDIDLAPMRARLAELRAARQRPAFRPAEVTLAGERPGAPPPARLRDWALAEAERALAAPATPELRMGLVARRDDAPTSRDIVQIAPLDPALRPVAAAEPVVGSVHNMPVNDGAYDLLVCDDLLAGIREPAWALRELTRLLRPGGTLVVATPLATSAAPGLLDAAGLAACLGEAAGPEVAGLDGARIARAATALRGRPAPAGPAWAAVVLRRPPA